MLRSVITMANVSIVKNAKYPFQFILELIHLNATITPYLPSEETIYFNITADTTCDLGNLLSKYDDEYILIFESEQSASYHVRWIAPDIISFSVSFYNTLQTKEYLLSAADMKSLFPQSKAREEKSLMSEQQAEIGDTILIDSQNEDIREKYRGKEFIITAIRTSVVSGQVYVRASNDSGDSLLFSPDEYSIVSKQNIKRNCPECKGTGKVLLFNFDSPCSLCNLTG